MATLKRFDEVEAFKEQVTKDFLLKHKLKYEDIAQGKISPSGHVFSIERNDGGFTEQDEQFTLSLYKLVDRQTHTITRNIVITYTTEPAPKDIAKEEKHE